MTLPVWNASRGCSAVCGGPPGPSAGLLPGAPLCNPRTQLPAFCHQTPLPLPPARRRRPQELGWNGIHLNQVSNGWVRGVRVENGDMGVYFWGTVFCTLDDLELVSTPVQRGWFNGHRGVWLEHGSDNLMKK